MLIQGVRTFWLRSPFCFFAGGRKMVYTKDDILNIKTFYEQQWLDRGLTIKYISFICENRDRLIEPNIEIEYDNYRSFNRSKRSENKEKIKFLNKD